MAIAILFELRTPQASENPKGSTSGDTQWVAIGGT